MDEPLFVKITEYKGRIIIDGADPEIKHKNWVPRDETKIGYVVLDTANHLGVSKEALVLLRQIKKSHDDIGDIDWWWCANETYAFAWIGGNKMIAHPESSGSRNYFTPPPGDVGPWRIIENNTPAEAMTAIDGDN